jgi:hypothetical protein
VAASHLTRCIQKFPDWLITKYTLTFCIITPRQATQRVMAAKLLILTHTIALQLHLVAENCTVCSSGSGRPVRKLLDTHCATAEFEAHFVMLWLYPVNTLIAGFIRWMFCLPHRDLGLCSCLFPSGWSGVGWCVPRSLRLVILSTQ